MAYSKANAVAPGSGRARLFLKAEEILQGVMSVDQNAVSVALVPQAGSTTNKATFVRGFKAPAAIGTPEALAASGTYVQKVTIFAIRASRTTNTSSVWVDGIATNNAQSIELLPGSAGNPMGAFVSFEAPPGKVIDLADIYVDAATVTDGVFYLGMI